MNSSTPALEDLASAALSKRVIDRFEHRGTSVFIQIGRDRFVVNRARARVLLEQMMIASGEYDGINMKLSRFSRER